MAGGSTSIPSCSTSQDCCSNITLDCHCLRPAAGDFGMYVIVDQVYVGICSMRMSAEVTVEAVRSVSAGPITPIVSIATGMKKWLVLRGVCMPSFFPPSLPWLPQLLSLQMAWQGPGYQDMVSQTNYAYPHSPSRRQLNVCPSWHVGVYHQTCRR